MEYGRIRENVGGLPSSVDSYVLYPSMIITNTEAAIAITPIRVNIDNSRNVLIQESNIRGIIADSMEVKKDISNI